MISRSSTHTLAVFFGLICCVDSFLVHSNCHTRQRLGSSLSSAETDEDKKTLNSDLPDYGKTPIEIDQIRLKRAKGWRGEKLFGKTLVNQTMEEMALSEEYQEVQRRLKEEGQEQLSKEERTNRRRALDSLGIASFESFVDDKVGSSKKLSLPLERKTSTVLQVNIGLYCNQACTHCHVESSPLRTEAMSAETAARIIKILQQSPSIKTLDITGGAPELNENFRYMVKLARSLRPDLEIIDRCNLTVLQEPGQEDLVDFLKENRVRIVASLPCYSAENVNKQRGNQVFERSIAALLALNEAGYGQNPELVLDLVYNPLGAFLPPEQGKLEGKYKEELDENFGILFNSLFTMTNMPVKRFADFLHRRGELKEYMDLLQRNFNTDTLDSLMCLDTVSVGYDGKIYDCDFNQQLGYSITKQGSADGLTVDDIDSIDGLLEYKIRNDNHCFGCTAGMGSS